MIQQISYFRERMGRTFALFRTIKYKAAIFLFSSFFASLPSAHAHCPLCSAAIGAGAVAAGYYGVDMSIIGIFVGAFAISTGLWVAGKIKRKYIPLQSFAIVLASFLLTVVPVLSVSKEELLIPLLLFGKTGTLLNKVYWFDKLLLGSIIGGLTTIFGLKVHNLIKQARGRVLFPYQSIAITIGFLVLASISLYFTMGV